MHYKLCSECPDFLREKVRESHDLFTMAMYEYGYCGQVIENEKPKYVAHSFTNLDETKIPDWCPYKQEKKLGV